MFEWLVDEMAKINTRKFHLVHGLASPELRKAVETSAIVGLHGKQFVAPEDAEVADSLRD